jgi:hypothetical protein
VKNYPLLRKTLEHIEAHPEEHDQGTWGLETQCGTTMCFAGQAVVLDGLSPIWTNLIQGPADERQMISVVMKDGTLHSVYDGAQRILGLSNGEAEALFMDCMTLEDVRVLVAELLAEEGADGGDGVE